MELERQASTIRGIDRYGPPILSPIGHRCTRHNDGRDAGRTNISNAGTRPSGGTSLEGTIALIHARAGERNMNTAVQTLITYMRGCLKATTPGVPSLGGLDLEDHLTGARKRLWRELVPENPPPTPQGPTYIMNTSQ